MTPIARLNTWARHPKVQPAFAVFAGFFWIMTTLNIVWAHRFVQRAFDSRAKTQAARMNCEASGGFYGSPVGAAIPSDRCFEPGVETALADRRTR